MTATDGRRAIVVGAGVGGLTAAIALQRLAGMEVAVFERARDVKRIQVGGGLQVWTNAMKAMKQLGLMDELVANSADLERFEFRTDSGNVMIRILTSQMSQELGAPSVGVSRVDLHKILLDALPEGVVNLGSDVTGFSQDKDGVTIRLADGREEHGAILIAADGGRSILRNQVVGPTPAQYAGYSIWQTVGHLGSELPERDLFGIWHGRGKRFIFYRVGGGQQHWAAIVNAVPGGGVSGSQKAALLEWYRGWDRPIEAMIQATAESDISRVDMYARPKPLRTWGSGPVTLLGDAAHPVTLNLGQGACQAIEDGVVLAKQLRAAPDLVTGLRNYESARQPRTASILTVAWNIGRIGQLNNPLLCWIRNTAMSNLQGFFASNTRSWSAYEV